MAITEGKKAPPFSLLGSDKKKHTLKDYQGKTIILFFYPKDNTSGCTKEACGLRDNYKKLTKQNIVVLGVSRDDIPSHESFIKNFKLPYVLLSDPETKTMKKYGAWGEKIMYGKKVTGTIRSTCLIGPDGKVIKHWTKVKDAGEHPAEIMAFLEKSKSKAKPTRSKALPARR